MNKMTDEMILVIDFGGQYNQLIARRVRECGVYSEIMGYESIDPDRIRGFPHIGLRGRNGKPGNRKGDFPHLAFRPSGKG